MGFLQEKDRQRLMISLNMMRMSCNSTYIIDQRTRHDTKINELMSILEEILDLQEEKVVIFSQWERMTRIVAGELDELGVRYEYLHGGVPSVKRKDLYKNFNQNPETKVFLSTDAGGVGLNLQAASYMVNLDIPWNPAVLEQRIARIYRMGQRRKVSIINLVASGTIEHRMLDVLKFKSSMAGGVLDRGEDAIFMSEDRFKQFMNSVENVVADTAESTPLSDAGFVEQQEEREAMTSPEESTHEVTAGLFMEESPEQEEEKDKSGVGSGQEPAQGQRETVVEGPELLTNGLKFFSQLSRTLQDREATEKLVTSITEKDKDTGKTYLKIPVEDEKVVEEAMSALGTLFKMLQK
jgi:superfamily II DNA/RNA helicase